MIDMRGHGSLKQRLLFLALTTVIIVWMAAAAFTYFDATDEFGEVLDSHLTQSATLLVIEVSHNFDEAKIEHKAKTEHIPLPRGYSSRVAFQVWAGGRVLRLRSANAPEQPLAGREQGFSDEVIDGNRWRVFSTWDESKHNLIHVAELTKDREELSSEISGNLLKPFLFSLPLLAISLWVAVARSLQPLVRLTSEVAQREPDNLAPLDAERAPREIVPLIERINKLFGRIDASLQKERRFTADAAHELRTPVAGIKAQAQVARAATNEAERIHALDRAILGCDRAAHLIDQLLTLARIDMLGEEVTEPCPLRAIAAEVIAAIAPAALNQNVRLGLTEGSEVAVRGNPALLRILLRNLIDNAVRHTRPETSVRVDIAKEHEQIRLSVTDNGPGIPESELDKVGERFYRPLGTTASGSGLGLSIVKRIAEIHSASLQLAAQGEGGGLSVTVVFKS
jgi:two-component system sensor histidine kinase QseC